MEIFTRALPWSARYAYANQITVIPNITVTHVTKDGDF